MTARMDVLVIGWISLSHHQLDAQMRGGFCTFGKGFAPQSCMADGPRRSNDVTIEHTQHAIARTPSDQHSTPVSVLGHIQVVAKGVIITLH